MISHSFILGPVDTDSISFCKQDQSSFTEKEQEELINEINSLMPPFIKYSHDGYFKKIIVLKTKNYILWDGKKIKHKGSSIKSSTLEPALKEFIHEIIQSIINEQYNYVEIYNKYVKEIDNIQDIRRWASKKSLSATTFKSERANETKIIDAIQGTEYVEGDRVYLYFKPDDTLSLVDNFEKGCYNKARYLEKLHKATKRFEAIIDPKLFLNYKLKKNQRLLETI